MLDLADAVDQGKVSLPAPIKKLILSTVRETYDWQQASNLCIAELQDKVAHIDVIMNGVAKKGVVQGAAA